MKGLKAVALTFLAYAILLIVSGVSYVLWSGDSGEVPGLVVRLVGVVVVAFGLWNSKRWAWQLGIVVSIFFGIAGVLSVATVFMTDILESRPYPMVDYVVLTGSAVLLIASAVVLILPSTRKSTMR